jgi:predicted enzyme related to lactoylglutathione lyase
MHAIHWFEIPVTDLARATAFYGRMLGIAQFRHETGGGAPMAIFPYDQAVHGVGGALVQSPRMQPAATGAIVYLNAGQDLAGAVERAVAAGGRVAMPVTDIGDPGHIALVADTEGNVVGLHQPPAGTPA